MYICLSNSIPFIEFKKMFDLIAETDESPFYTYDNIKTLNTTKTKF